jgi:hypothetical protein
MPLIGRDPRYRMPAQTRKFGGAIYRYLYIGNKADVERLRKPLANEAKLPPLRIRTVKFGKQLAIYTRRGR